MKVWHFLAAVGLVALFLVGYHLFFSPQIAVKRTLSSAAKAFERLDPSLIDFLCESFGHGYYNKKEAEKDWEHYRNLFSRAKVRLRVRKVSVRFYFAECDFDLKVMVHYQGSYYMLVGEWNRWESGRVFLLKRKDGKWCINRLFLPSFQRWIEQRLK